MTNGEYIRANISKMNDKQLAEMIVRNVTTNSDGHRTELWIGNNKAQLTKEEAITDAIQWLGENKNTKSYLMFDTPDSCDKCLLRYCNYHDYCIGTEDNKIIDYNIGKIQPWCPLKHIPTKFETYPDCDKFYVGYNSCIDDIVNEFYIVEGYNQNED